MTHDGSRRAAASGRARRSRGSAPACGNEAPSSEETGRGDRGPATAGAGGPRETAALCGEVARPPPCPPPWKSRTWEGRSVTRMQHGADGTERDAGDQVVLERGGSFGRRGKNSTHAGGGVERSLEEGRPPQTARAPLRGGAWKGGEEGLRGALGRQGARFLCRSLVPFDVAVRRGGGGAGCGAAGPAGCSGPAAVRGSCWPPPWE